MSFKFSFTFLPKVILFLDVHRGGNKESHQDNPIILVGRQTGSHQLLLKRIWNLFPNRLRFYVWIWRRKFNKKRKEKYFEFDNANNKNMEALWNSDSKVYDNDNIMKI